jgi:hypothetical protein
MALGCRAAALPTRQRERTTQAELRLIGGPPGVTLRQAPPSLGVMIVAMSDFR